MFEVVSVAHLPEATTPAVRTQLYDLATRIDYQYSSFDPRDTASSIMLHIENDLGLRKHYAWYVIYYFLSEKLGLPDLEKVNELDYAQLKKIADFILLLFERAGLELQRRGATEDDVSSRLNALWHDIQDWFTLATNNTKYRNIERYVPFPTPPRKTDGRPFRNLWAVIDTEEQYPCHTFQPPPWFHHES